MAFVASQGQIAALSRPAMVGARSLAIAPGYTLDYSQIYARHGSVRTTVGFLGRNIASLGLHLFERTGDADRRRVTDHPLVDLLGQPNPWTTAYKFADAMVQDLATYDRFLAVKMRPKSGGLGLVRVPATQYELKGDTWLFPEAFEVVGGNGRKEYAREDVLYIEGYSPAATLGGSSPIESLRSVLAEEYEAARMREQVFRNGARVSGYLERPKEAGDWSQPARERFRAQWRAQYTGDGPGAGGTPVLEDGMKFVPAAQSAKDLQYIESRKLTREEVASAFYIPPPMIGLLEHATFSNIKEQHKHLYQDTLGPWLQMLAQELMLQLFPEFGGMDGMYLEYNMEEKLRGSFEDQATQLQTAVGGPYLTRNEARAILNRPAIEGGDELITPLNVTEGGQASPTDSGTQNVLAGPQPAVKADEPDPKARFADVDKAAAAMEKAITVWAEGYAGRLAEHFGITLEGKAAGTLTRPAMPTMEYQQTEADALSDVMFNYSQKVALATGTMMLADYAGDVEPDWGIMDGWLREASKTRALEAVTKTTEVLAPALAELDWETPLRAAIGGLFMDQFALYGMAAATGTHSFAARDTATQLSLPKKTWYTTSRNPRETHAAQDGLTVDADDYFPNGCKHPGDWSGGADEVSGCQCRISYN